jgi:WD40 repeat protein
LTWSRWYKDGSINIWSNDGEHIAKLLGHSKRVNCVIILEGGLVLSLAEDKTICLWNYDGKLLAKITHDEENFNPCSATVMNNQSILLWSENSVKICRWNHENSDVKFYDDRIWYWHELLRKGHFKQKNLIFSTYIDDGGENYSRSICLRYSTPKTRTKIFWQGKTWCYACSLFPRGTAIVSGTDMYFLQLYIGGEKASISNYEEFCNYSCH